MTLSKCQCGRSTDFGTLCVFCARDQLLKDVDEDTTEAYTSEPELPLEEDED